MNVSMIEWKVIQKAYSQERLKYMACLLRKQGERLSRKGLEDFKG